MTPEVYGSNVIIGTHYITYLTTVNCIEKTKVMKRRPGIAQLKNDFQIFIRLSSVLKWTKNKVASQGSPSQSV